MSGRVHTLSPSCNPIRRVKSAVHALPHAIACNQHTDCVEPLHNVPHFPFVNRLSSSIAMQREKELEHSQTPTVEERRGGQGRNRLAVNCGGQWRWMGRGAECRPSSSPTRRRGRGTVQHIMMNTWWNRPSDSVAADSGATMDGDSNNSQSGPDLRTTFFPGLSRRRRPMIRAPTSAALRSRWLPPLIHLGSIFLLIITRTIIEPKLGLIPHQWHVNLWLVEEVCLVVIYGSIKDLMLWVCLVDRLVSWRSLLIVLLWVQKCQPWAWVSHTTHIWCNGVTEDIVESVSHYCSRNCMICMDPPSIPYSRMLKLVWLSWMSLSIDDVMIISRWLALLLRCIATVHLYVVFVCL